MRSFIRWAGSKRLSLGQIKPYCPKAPNRYIEPFAGSACLFFELEPKSAVLGDLNRELIFAMRAIRRDVYRVVECLRRLPVGRKAYYRVRQTDPTSLSEVEMAARFLYLNRHCFNGLYRTNLAGKFNVPYGSPKPGASRAVVDEELLSRAAVALRSARFVYGDFEETLAFAESGDFAYLDPPYAIDEERVFDQYLPASFGRRDLARLSRALTDLDRRNVTFLITYGESAEARDLLGPWKPVRIQTRRNIAGFAGHRRIHYELLATNSGNAAPCKPA